MENLNNVPSTGTFGGSVSTINSNFDLVVNAINSLEYQTTRSKGILNYGQNPATVFPNAVAGDWCMILSQGNVFPATIKTYNGSTWSGSGTWNPDGVDLTGYAKTTDMTTAIANSLAQATARMGYGECTVSGTSLAVSIPNFILPTSGGTVHIKMSAVGTGASTLNINSTGAKTLWYNGKAVSSTNTWETGEIISVFYDGTKYMSSNSQGGGGDAEKIKYDNSQSGLASNNVQGALDEIKPMFEHLDDVPVDFGTMSNSVGDFTWVQGNVESGQINPNYKNAYTIFSIDESSTLMEINFTLPGSHTAVLYYYNGNKYISTGVKKSKSFNPQKYGYFTYLLQVVKAYPSHADFSKVSTMKLTVHTVSYNSYIPNTQYRILALENKVPNIDEAYSISTSSVVGNNVEQVTTKANIFANTDVQKVYYRANGNIWNREWNNVIHNPVMSINFPDPTIIKVGNYYYMAATITRIALYKSTDLANWEYVKRIIPSDFDYSQVNNVTSFWAPELNYIDGRYVCFISANTNNNDRFTFSMVADDIEGNWEFNSITVSVAGKNQIDPAYAEENGVKYIFCGSWSGIYRYVLDDETLAATDGGTQVVRTNIEATVLYKYGDYWYMFTSSGDTFTYSYCIHIARSATLDGTFINKNGQSSVGAAGTKILSSASTDILLGPGHPSNIITANGKMYMLFHNMIKGLEGSGTNAIRYPMLMRIVEGPDGWLAFADKDGNVVTKPTWETTVL